MGTVCELAGRLSRLLVCVYSVGILGGGGGGGVD